MSGSRRFLIALSLVAVGLLAALAWYVIATEANADTVHAEHGVEPPSGPSASLSAGPDARSTPESASERSIAASGARATKGPPPYVPTDGLRLVVIDAGTRERLAGAIVRVVETDSDRYGLTLQYEDWLGPDVEAYMIARGRAFTADENGEVELPPTRRQRLVTGRAEGRFHFERFHPSARGLFDLQLRASHSLTARVVDANRLPRRGVPVGLAACDDTNLFWQSTTDAEGNCRIPDIEVLFEEVGTDSLKSSFSVVAGIPCAPRVEAWIETAALPTTPIELVLPETGSVLVKIVDEVGQVLPVTGTFDLTASRAQADGAADLGRDGIVQRVPLVAGVARVADVGLGVHLQIEADLLGTGDASAEAEGPRTAGEEVVVSVPFPEDHTLLSGRIVDDQGRPIAERTFDWRRILDDGRTIQASGRNPLRTDATGRFTWTLRRSAADTGESTHRTGFLCEETDALVRLQATVTFPLEIGRARTDLGDIVASARGPLVHGRVLDDQDHGVEGVSVYPRIWLGAETYDADTFDSDTTRADGSFALFGPCLALDLRVTFEGPGIDPVVTERVECSKGPVELTIRTQRVGALAGTALVGPEPGLDVAIVYVSTAAPPGAAATAGAGGAATESTWWGDWRRAGERIEFEFRGLPVGRGRVEFRPPDEGGPPYVVVNDVEVSAGGISRPSSLVDVDLRGKLKSALPDAPAAAALEFTVVDSLGRAVPRGVAWALWDAENWEGEHYFAGGRVRLPAGVKRVEFWAPGLRTHVLHEPIVGGRITLQPAYEVEFRLELPKQMTGKEFTYLGRFWPRPDEHADPTSPFAGMTPVAATRVDSFPFDRRGRARLALPASGKFDVMIELTVKGIPPGTESVFGLGLEVGEFSVRDADGRQVVDLRIQRESLDEVMDALGLSK